MGSAHASGKLNLFKAFRFIFETADVLVPHASADTPRLAQLYRSEGPAQFEFCLTL